MIRSILASDIIQLLVILLDLHSPIKMMGLLSRFVGGGGGGVNLFLAQRGICATEQGMVFRVSSLNWAYNLTMNRVSF